jgi:hypothetical protein
MSVNVPARFSGSEAEKAANFDSHGFDWESGRCWKCDCRPFGRVAEWPCGASVPREDVSDAEGSAAVASLAAGVWMLGSAA